MQHPPHVQIVVSIGAERSTAKIEELPLVDVSLFHVSHLERLVHNRQRCQVHAPAAISPRRRVFPDVCKLPLLASWHTQTPATTALHGCTKDPRFKPHSCPAYEYNLRMQSAIAFVKVLCVRYHCSADKSNSAWFHASESLVVNLVLNISGAPQHSPKTP